MVISSGLILNVLLLITAASKTSTYSQSMQSSLMSASRRRMANQSMLALLISDSRCRELRWACLKGSMKSEAPGAIHRVLWIAIF